MAQYTNPSPTGLITVSAGGSSTTETVVPGMDATGLTAGQPCDVTIDYWEAVNQSGFVKNVLIRLRDGGLTGTVLASHLDAGTHGDSTAGHQEEWNAALRVTPATSRLCVTAQATSGAPQVTSDTRTFVVSDPVSSTGTNYSATILADSPAAYYRLGETSGTTMADSSGNGHDGTYVTTYTQSTVPLVTDAPNTAVNFLGGRADSPLGPWLDSDHVTAEAWCKPTALSGLQEVVLRDNVGNPPDLAWRIRLNGSKVEWIYNNGSVQILSSNATLVAGNIYHLVGTFDGTNAKLYINGTLDKSVGAGGVIIRPSASPLRIGALAGNSEPLNGVIDEVAFYTTPLSATRIAAHYTAGSTLPAPTGTISTTLPSLTSTASGTYGPSGTVSAALPGLTATTSGTYGPSGSISATLPSLSGSLSGGYAPSGVSASLSATLPSLTGNLAGAYSETAALSATLPSLTASITADYVSPPAVGILVTTLPSLTTTIAAVEGNDFLIVTLPSLSGSIAGHVSPVVQVGTNRANRGNGIRLSGSATVDVETSSDDTPPGLRTTVIHVVTPTVPAPALVNGRPQ